MQHPGAHSVLSSQCSPGCLMKPLLSPSPLLHLPQSRVWAVMQPLMFHSPPCLSGGLFSNPPNSASREGNGIPRTLESHLLTPPLFIFPHVAGLEVFPLTFLSCWDGMSPAASFPVSLTCPLAWGHEAEQLSGNIINEAEKNIWNYNSKLLSNIKFICLNFLSHVNIV